MANQHALNYYFFFFICGRIVQLGKRLLRLHWQISYKLYNTKCGHLFVFKFCTIVHDLFWIVYFFLSRVQL